MIPREEQSLDNTNIYNTTVMMFCLPPWATAADQNEIVASMLDQYNAMNRAAGGGDFEIGEIQTDTDENGVFAKKVTLHGQIWDENLRMPDVIRNED